MPINFESFHLVPFYQQHLPSMERLKRKIDNLHQTLKVVEVEPFEDAIARIRGAHLGLSTNNTLRPFESAKIYTKLITPEDVLPCSYYVLIQRLIYQDEFTIKMWDEGIDVTNPPGMVYYTTKDDSGEVILGAYFPLLVEKYFETYSLFGGQMVTALQDGHHRLSRFNIHGKPQLAIIFEGATQEVLPHQVPNPLGWRQVEYGFTVPEFPVKKIYRIGIIKDIRPYRGFLRYANAQWGNLPRRESI